MSDATNEKRVWVVEPGTSEQAVSEATGRGWNEWCDIIDAWWAQSVTVGYERMTGLRLPYQRADGTFTASRSRTVSTSAENVSAALVGEGGLTHPLPGGSQLLLDRSAKALRFAVSKGVATISVQPLAGCGRGLRSSTASSPNSARWRFGSNVGPAGSMASGRPSEDRWPPGRDELGKLD